MIKNVLIHAIKIAALLGFIAYAAHSLKMSSFNVEDVTNEIEYVKSDSSLLLTNDNTIIIRGTVGWTSVAKWSAKLAIAALKRKNNAPIYLVIDSGGGGITSGLSFITFAKQFKNIHTVTLWAASMAAAIVEGLPGKRYVAEGGQFMFHRATATCSGQVERGELEECVRSVKRIVIRMEKSNARRIGISLKEYKKKVLNEWWVDSDESITFGVADKIVDVRCSEDLLNRTYSQTISTFFGNRKVKFSKCPLIRGPLQ